MVIPNLLYKTKLPKDLPEELEVVVSEVKKTNSKREALRKAHKIVTSKYHGDVIPTYTKFHRLFGWDAKSIWKEHGYLHCTKQNYLLRLLLVKSEWFEESDVKQKKMLLCGLSPHQYLQIKVDGAWVDVDCWADVYKVPIGKHATCKLIKRQK